MSSRRRNGRVMWDRLIASSNAERLLPSGRNWAFKSMSFDRVTMEISVESSKTNEMFTASFNPIYYSVSDEWVEAYSGLEKDRTDMKLEDVVRNIGQSFPEQMKNYAEAKLYFASAMEWSIRFVSYETPKVSLSQIKGLTNAN